MGGWPRRVAPGALAVALAGLVGCAAPADSGQPGPGPVTSRAPLPPAYAGGACQLLDYAAVATAVGTRFDIAAARQVQETYTCVLQRTEADLPDLALSVTPVPNLDPTTFKAKLFPKGASSASQLGRIGYRAVLPAATGTGPVVEVGWLSGNQRLLVLRLRTATGTATADATELAPKLVVLAQQIDVASV